MELTNQQFILLYFLFTFALFSFHSFWICVWFALNRWFLSFWFIQFLLFITNVCFMDAICGMLHSEFVLLIFLKDMKIWNPYACKLYMIVIQRDCEMLSGFRFFFFCILILCLGDELLYLILLSSSGDRENLNIGYEFCGWSEVCVLQIVMGVFVSEIFWELVITFSLSIKRQFRLTY